MSKKLWEWGAQKRKPTVCAINAQSGTGLKIAPPPPSACNIGNGNSCKIPCKPYARTIVALIQSSYEQEAVGMRSTKTQTPRLCNQRTKRNELANRSASTIGVQYRRWKFVQIPCKPYARTIVALMQCTYEEEAVGIGSPKTQSLFCAINAQSGTSLQIAPPPPSQCNIDNGISCKFPSNLTPEQ